VAETVELEVPASLDGERLDKVLAEMLELSRSRAAALVRSGVEIDGVPARASDRAREGQLISCERPEGVARLEPEPVEFGVLYEDEALIVVDKPAGLVVHPGSGRQRGTLAAGLIESYPELVGVGAEGRWGLVHRLDKDTSGALLVARTKDSHKTLTEAIRCRRVGRVYTALVEGRLTAPTGTIEAPIGRDPSRPTRRTVTHTGKHARTHYEVVREFEEVNATLLQVKLETGRTHQIRVHMSAIGHPVAGDITYGASRKDIGSPRTFLHAARLEFIHPTTGEGVTVESPLPPDLSAVLDHLS
jgi:23S rRNA pseudouridine1911/1915/1917 synthase